MKRPLVLFCLALITGILSAHITRSYMFAALSCAVVGIIILALPAFSTQNRFITLGIVLFYLFGAVYYLYSYNQNFHKFEEFSGKQVVVKGYIDSAPDIKDSRVSYTLRTKEVSFKEDPQNIKKVDGKVLFSTLNSGKVPILEYGRAVEISGRLNLPKGRTNPGGFDFRRYLGQSGISATVFAAERNIHPKSINKGNILVKAGLFLRTRIVNVVNNSLPPQQAGLLNGMLIGYREGLSEEVQEVFSNSGLTHIMAVSGANIGFIVFPLIFVFKKLRLRQNIANIIIINILVVFTFITGFEPSVLRAVIMAVVILVGQIIKRETEVFTSISFAAIVLLLYNPGNLFNIGFQLSFTATISLVLFYKNIKDKINFKFVPEFITDVLAATLAAQLGVLPVTVFYFNKISVVSVLSNLIVVPVLEFITILGSLMAVLGQIHIVFAKLIGYPNNALLSFVLFATKTTADFPSAVVRATTPSIILIIAYYIVIVFAFWYKPKYKVKAAFKHYVLTGMFVLTLISINIFVPKGLEVVFLDVGQGDCAFIRTGTGKTVLIDGGGDNMGESVVIPFLLDYGVSSLDLVVATHGHDDHTQGLISVLEEFKVDNIVIPDIPPKEGIVKLIEIAEDKEIDIGRCSKGDLIRLDDKTHFDVLHPKSDSYIEKSPLNNNSLVLKLNYKRVSVLFTGDIEKEAESTLVEDGVNIEADVLKVAHHGSSTSTIPEFLDRARPAAAVISVGRNNFGHPSSEVLELIKDKRINVLRTDRDGAVILKTFGDRIRLIRINSSN